MEIERGSVVKILRGKGKNRLMCVVKVERSSIYVCDGKVRKLINPKLKNPKHIESTDWKLEEKFMVSDRSIRKALNLIGEAYLCQNRI